MTECRLKEEDRAEILLAAGCGGAQLEGPYAAHIRDCVSCSQACARQSQLWRELSHWKVPEVSESFDRELYAKIDSALGEPWYEVWSQRIREAFSLPAFAVAAVSAVLVTGFILDHPHQPVRAAQSAQAESKRAPSLAVSMTEAEQVEQTLDDLEMLRQFDLNTEEKEATSKSM